MGASHKENERRPDTQDICLDIDHEIVIDIRPDDHNANPGIDYGCVESGSANRLYGEELGWLSLVHIRAKAANGSIVGRCVGKAIDRD